MSNVQLFNFKSNQIRVVEIDGEPWFVAADVCRVLGFAQRANGTVNVNNIRSVVSDEETITCLAGKTGRPSLCISESGLYKLVMRSDKPEARRFQDWVTKEVLPAIRKDGGYIMGEEKVKTGEMSEDEFLARTERDATVVQSSSCYELWVVESTTRMI